MARVSYHTMKLSSSFPSKETLAPFCRRGKRKVNEANWSIIDAQQEQHNAYFLLIIKWRIATFDTKNILINNQSIISLSFMIISLFISPKWVVFDWYLCLRISVLTIWSKSVLYTYYGQCSMQAINEWEWEKCADLLYNVYRRISY